jgi:aldehyde:ferredoxin oxidoreductase
MQGGYTGKMLFVDLSTGQIKVKTPHEKLYRAFLGGYGIGAKVLFCRQQAYVDPLGAENILGFVTGPLTGTPSLFASRFMLVSKSPLTSTWGDSNCGGSFGPQLKFAGYDAIFFSGISEKPVYLLIDEGHSQLKDADHLWGKDTVETENILYGELGKQIKVVSIGPSGERLSLISAVITEKGRAAGRSGLGAVMGSKKLKAVVVRGQQAVPIADMARLKTEGVKRLREIKNASPTPVMGTSLLWEFGTCGMTNLMVQIGGAAIKNWNVVGENELPDFKSISGKAFIEGQQRRYGCWRCPIACGGIMRAGKGQYEYKSGTHKPEYETIAAFGINCLNGNMESIVKLNDICNRYGLDTISTGCTIAFAIECYERGIIDDKDTENIKLTWGNHHAIVKMTDKLARREGFGDILADGVMRAAKRIGNCAEKYAIHIRGQEVPSPDPKRFPYFATTYATNATPARHTQGSEGYLPLNLKVPTFDRKSCIGRGEAHKIGSNMMHAINCAGVCQFGYMYCIDVHALPEFLSAVTGMQYTIEDLLRVGERIANLRQAFNIREGYNFVDTIVPKRVLGNPSQKLDPKTNRGVDIKGLAIDYFTAMCWDTDTGKPSKDKLLELGLDDIAEALWPTN